MKLPLLFPVLILVALSAHAQEELHLGWGATVIGAGVKPSFDFDADDNIHVMGMTEQTVGGVVWHASAAVAAGPWSPEVVAAGYFYGPGDIRVDQSGRAHLAWHDHDNQAPQHVVVATDGTTSSHILPSPGQHDGWDNSLFVAPGGTVHMACVDPSNFGASDCLQHGTFDGTTWTFDSAVAGSGSFMYGLNTSISLDSGGTAHVLYCQSEDWVAGGNLIHASSSSPTWSFDTIDSGVGVGRFPSLAIDQDDNLHATWLDVDPDNQSTGTVRYGYLPAGGNTWQIQPVITLDALSLGFSGARKSASIAVDASSIPHIAYADTQTVGYAILTLNDGWQPVTVLSDPAGIYKSLAVLRLDSAGRAAIAMWQSEGGNDTVRLLRQLPLAGPEELIDLGLRTDGRTITYTTADAGLYQLQASTDLKSWQPHGEPIQSTGTPMEITASATPGTRGFYRVTFEP